MATAYVVSTVLMGALVVGVVAATVRSRRWYNYAPTTTAGAASESGGVLDQTRTWILAFAALTVVLVGTVLAFVTNPSASSSLGGGPVVAVTGVLLGLYLLLGSYVTARQRGHSNAIAAAEAATVAGVLLLVGVSAQLIGA